MFQFGPDASEQIGSGSFVADPVDKVLAKEFGVSFRKGHLCSLTHTQHRLFSLTQSDSYKERRYCISIYSTFILIIKHF